jgi:hypothetical protein
VAVLAFYHFTKLKTKDMRKILMIALTASLFAACNDAENTTTESDTTSSTMTAPPVDGTVSSPGYAPQEGDVSYREKRVQVWRGGTWVDSDEDVKLDNNVVVYRNGRASRDGREIELEDGVIVDRSGNVFDRTGAAVSNAWENVKEAGKDVKDEVTGDEAKDRTR